MLKLDHIAVICLFLNEDKYRKPFVTSYYATCKYELLEYRWTFILTWYKENRECLILPLLKSFWWHQNTLFNITRIKLLKRKEDIIKKVYEAFLLNFSCVIITDTKYILVLISICHLRL